MENNFTNVKLELKEYELTPSNMLVRICVYLSLCNFIIKLLKTNKTDKHDSSQRGQTEKKINYRGIRVISIIMQIINEINMPINN